MDVAGIFSALIDILGSPYYMLLLMIAVPVGIFFGIVPGLGGKLGIVLCIPFVFGMETTAGALFLIAMHAVVHTGGAVPSILFGVPGTGPDAATVVDGLPMTRRGEAGRALGAGFLASGVGGVIGGLFLMAVLPLLRPMVLAFSPAEFFLIAIFGITFVAMLSGDSLVKGLIVGLFGLLLGTVMLDPQTGIQRYTFDMLFLWDGVDIITAVLGLYAIPEMISLGIAGGSIAQSGRVSASFGMAGVFRGMLDVVKHWALTVRTSIIGAVIGLIPGLGGDAASWISYGHAVQSSKHPEKFGKGAVEGVIAAETATNSKEGGSLLPTLFFAVPGSSGMAIILGAFIMLGIQPGPALALTDMDLVWTLMWGLMLANIVAIFMLVALAPGLGYLSYVRGNLLIPIVLVLTFLGAYLGHRAWENMVLLVVLGFIGYLLKKYDWARPPFIIGLILGPIAEDSFHKAMALWGPAFMLRPGALVMSAIIVLSVGLYAWRSQKRSSEEHSNAA